MEMSFSPLACEGRARCGSEAGQLYNVVLELIFRSRSEITNGQHSTGRGAYHVVSYSGPEVRAETLVLRESQHNQIRGLVTGIVEDLFAGIAFIHDEVRLMPQVRVFWHESFQFIDSKPMQIRSIRLTPCS